METRNYVIAGGTSGIGAALSLQLANEGHEVFVYARNRHELPENINIHFSSVDFSQDSFQLNDLPAVIHGFVYCPGSINLQPFHRTKADSFQADFKINVLGAVQCIQQCLSGLKNSGESSVVLFSTVAVQTGMGFHSSIAASKGAIEGLTRSLAAEYASSKIRFNCIAPSLTETPLADKLINTPEKKEAGAKRHPLGRIGEAKDISHAANFLLSENSSWITGQVIAIDGGMSSLRII